MNNINNLLDICQSFSKLTLNSSSQKNIYRHDCNCDDKFIITDDINGDIICSNCGLVKDQYIRLSSSTFDDHDNIINQETTSDLFFEKKTVSTFISNKPTKFQMSNLAKKLHVQNSCNITQSNRYKDFDVIDKMCNELKTTQNISNDAKKFFHDLCSKRIFRGKNRIAMMICTILHSLAVNKCERDLYEISNTQNIDRPTLTKNLKTYESITGSKIIQNNNKCQEVYRYLQQLHISDKDIFKISNDIISKRKIMLQMDEYQGRNPKTLMAIILHKDYGFDKKIIKSVLNVSITAY